MPEKHELHKQLLAPSWRRIRCNLDDEYFYPTTHKGRYRKGVAYVHIDVYTPVYIDVTMCVCIYIYVHVLCLYL